MEDNGTIILNPRDLSNTSLFLADMEWRHDLSIHRRWLDYKREQRK